MLSNILDLITLTSIFWVPLIVLSILSQHLVHLIGRKTVIGIGIIGVPIHEISHLTACLCCNHKIVGFGLYKPCIDGTLGYVNHQYRRTWITPICLLLIGLAPLIGGWLSFGLLTSLLRPDLAHFFSNYSINIQNAEQAMTFLSMFQKSIFTTGGVINTFVWMVLGFSILLFSVPSRADFQGCKWAVITLLCAFGLWFAVVPSLASQTIYSTVLYLSVLAAPLYIIILLLLPFLVGLTIKRVITRQVPELID